MHASRQIFFLSIFCNLFHFCHDYLVVIIEIIFTEAVAMITYGDLDSPLKFLYLEHTNLAISILAFFRICVSCLAMLYPS